MNPALLSSVRTDYGTPWEFFLELDREFDFTLDPCASPDNAKCPKFYTEADNGLEQDWGQERVFMNPPYGRAIPLWMNKAVQSWANGALVVALVPARTDTAWWHECVLAVEPEIRYIRGRIKFEGCTAAAPFPCAVVVYRP